MLNVIIIGMFAIIYSLMAWLFWWELRRHAIPPLPRFVLSVLWAPYAIWVILVD